MLFSNQAFSEEKAEKKPSPSLPVSDIFEKTPANVEVVADNLEYARQEKKIIAKSNVVVTYQNMKMTCDYAEVETESKKVYARGHVILFREDEPVARGEEVHYDFVNSTGSFPKGRSITPPWYGYGEEAEQIRKGAIVIRDGAITTCDLENPHYEIRAKKATIYENDKILAWNVKIYVLGKPVFWWPYLVIPLQQNNLPFNVAAGYSSEFGAYLELTKGFSVTKNIAGKLLGDWRSKRGFGGGGILDYDFGKYAQGSLIGYATQDRRAPTPNLDPPPGSPPDAEPPDAYSQLEKRDRGRITWRHRTDLDEYSYVLLRYNRLADEFFLQDFFEREYRAEVEPQSFVTLTKNTESFGFLTTLQKKMNSFEALVERMPEVRFNWKNQPFFLPGLFYENEISFANLSKRLSRSDYNEDVVRVDNFHEWTLPMKWKEIKLTPFASLEGTYYSREKESSDSRFRLAVGYGADLRTQFYKTWDVTFDKGGIEVNHLRHIFEPVFQYQAINPSTVSNETLNQFDNIDLIDDEEKIRFGFENRLQTKRVIDGRMRRVDIVSLNTFLSYAFHPDEPSSASGFTLLEQEVVLRPYQWLQYQARMTYDMDRDQFQFFNQDLVARTRRLRFAVGHRYVKDRRILDETGGIDTSHQFVFDIRWILNPLWQLGGYIRWDADQQELEEWQVVATRDLHDFILDFGYSVRSDSISSSNKELFFNFRMKAFPDFTLHGGAGRTTFSEPRIGETVSGSNVFANRYDDPFDIWNPRYPPPHRSSGLK